MLAFRKKDENRRKKQQGDSDMERNEEFLHTAESLKPKLYTKYEPAKATVRFHKDDNGKIMQQPTANYRETRLKKGDVLCLDFGAHLVGKVKLSFGYEGSHPDAPVWLKLKFAERPCELFENVEDYNGWICMGWIQHEQIHVDILPACLELPRRYAFRYLEITVLDVSRKFQLILNDAVCESSTSADDSKLTKYENSSARMVQLDAVACRTLRSCMQDVFEDGPKRDRRLWLGDFRMQALVNYETYQNFDLVKRCLYLFAGSTKDKGRIGACLFTEPEVEVDDTEMFDYSLFFIPTLLDYYKATGDMDTLRELAPSCWRQVELVQAFFDKKDLTNFAQGPGCFVDWNLELNKQASAQGIYLYCVRAAIEVAQILDDSKKVVWLISDYERKKKAAALLWDEEKRCYISGSDRQISWASQIWMILGGALDVLEGGKLLNRLEHMNGVEKMVTPYMYHNYVDALLTVGQNDKALNILCEYWGGMLDQGADTFWELYNPENPNESPYGGTIVNSYCHAWSCAPAYFLRKYFRQ